MKKRKYYEVWSEYDEFIKSLHLESEKEQEISGSWWRKYLKKLLVILFASFFTTFSFKFLMGPNGLYNSGLNGIIQIVSKYISNAKPTNWNFAFCYYGTVIVVNALMIALVQIFAPGNFEINSTAFFYVMAQYIWNNVFDYFQLKKFIFNRLTQKTWSGISGSDQLALTLPFYILIGIIGSVLHAFGYSFIYQAKSSPGGFDIISSAVLQKEEKNGGKKKRKFSIAWFSKILGFIVIFLITLISFIFIEDNAKLTVNQLIKDINKNDEDTKVFRQEIIVSNNNNFIKDKENLIETLQKLAKKKYSYSEENIEYSDFKDNKKAVAKEHETLYNVTKGLKTYLDLERHEDDIYLIIEYLKGGKKSILAYYEKKLEDPKDQLNQNEKEEIIKKIEAVKKNIYKMSFSGYLEYTTNNEQLWGSVIYVLVSSYFINEFFPKNKVFKIYFAVYEDNELDELLNYLNKYRNYYFKSNSVRDGKEEPCTIVCCLITKWNYQLISDKIGKFEKVAVCETDEKS